MTSIFQGLCLSRSRGWEGEDPGNEVARAASWKHDRAYYNVHKERWMIKDGTEHLVHQAKKPKDHPDHEPLEDMWSSDSSGDEDLEAAISNHVI